MIATAVRGATPPVKLRAPVPMHTGVTSVPGQRRRATGAAWALAFLATFSSVVFAIAAIAGWIVGIIPATPLTLAVAATIVVAGPLTAALHLRTFDAADAAVPAAPAPVRPAPTRPAPLRPLTPDQQWGRAIEEWRERPLQRSRARA
jgi:hypothetical protein